MSPFRFPRVLSTSSSWLSTEAISSLVVVLPTLPVIWTTGRSNSPRYQAARSFSARFVSCTST